MDVLLASAFFLKNDPKQIEKMRPYPPLGTLHAAAYLRTSGFEVGVFDAMLASGIDDFERLLAMHRPRIVVFYEDQFNFLNKMCLSHVRRAICQMTRLARDSGAQVFAAGADITDEPPAYFACGVQYILAGEADRSLLALVSAVLEHAGARISDIPGLVLPGPNGQGETHHTAKRPPESDLEHFPMPAWDLIDADPYRKAWSEAHGYFSLNMVSSRGCPFHCNWCAKPIWGQHYAVRSADKVAEEMAYIKRVHNPSHIWFADDIFGMCPKWVGTFADAIEARQAQTPFTIQSRVDLMTDTAVTSLARAGCREVWMGVESGSQRILDAMDKGTKLPMIPVVRRRLAQAGIRACFFIQFGYPGETFADIQATIDLVRATLPDEVGISVSYPLPGTKFHQRVQAKLMRKLHWEDSDDLDMIFQGTYQSPFYRQLHQLLHRDLDLRQRLRAASGENCALDLEYRALKQDWEQWTQSESRYRSPQPTTLDHANAAPVQVRPHPLGNPRG